MEQSSIESWLCLVFFLAGLISMLLGSKWMGQAHAAYNMAIKIYDKASEMNEKVTTAMTKLDGAQWNHKDSQ